MRKRVPWILFMVLLAVPLSYAYYRTIVLQDFIVVNIEGEDTEPAAESDNL